MALRAPDWKPDTATASDELRRAIEYLRSKAVKPEQEESELPES
jgi:hypothetical protein